MLPLSVQVPASIVLLAGGAMACFAGYRLFRLVLGVYGFILGALLASSLVGAGGTWTTVAAAVAGGAAGALVLLVGYFVGVALVGAGIGALAVNLAWKPFGGDPHWAVVLVVAAVGAIAAMKFQRYVIVLASAFAGASKLIETSMGALNTVVLITSSLTVALAYHYSRVSRGRLAAALLLVTLLLGGAFLVVKYFEYAHHFHDGHLPGRYYRYAALQVPGASMFWTVYFLMTGLHGIHVVAGMGVLAWLAVGAWRGSYGGDYSTPLEVGGMYWHLVDLVWIFLFPLLYLI